ncbi:hypothetical protein ATCC90586_011718 [Pythium insidiosum]|nr:hypothetical protein ATCC90586_011718 [Pythium insidiosum]
MNTIESDRTPSPPSNASLDERAMEPSQQKRKRSTYEARKIEIQELQQDLQLLQSQLLQLQRTRRQQHDDDEPTLAQSLARHEQLSVDVARTDRLLASLGSAVFRHQTDTLRSPMHTFVHLSASPDARIQALLALHPIKIRQGVEAILDRLACLDLTRDSRQIHEFESPDGDWIVSILDLTRFHGVTDVRCVHEANVQQHRWQEITVSEALGIVSVVESELEAAESGVQQTTQCHFLTSLGAGVQKEHNLVTFAEFSAASEQLAGPHSVFMLDFVDEDDESPYRPHERLREDVTAVNFAVNANTLDPTAPSDVIFARLAFMKLHKSQCATPPAMVQHARDIIVPWGRTLLSDLKQRLGVSS